MQPPTIIFRHSPPNKYDQAAYGTECHILSSEVIYIQKSMNDAEPDWQLKN